MNQKTLPITALLYRDELKGYDFGIGHPFRGNRFTRFYMLLKEKVPEDRYFRIIKADPANDQDLFLICDEEYVEFTGTFFGTSNLPPGIMDDFFKFHSMDNMTNARPSKLEKAARVIIGQAKKACELVQAGEYRKAISIGGGLHHAKRAYGEGFCLYNDVAFCAEYLSKRFGLKKILILDTDAHAGNGTADYFYSNPGVLLIDIHQDPDTIYPGTGYIEQIGDGTGKGFTVNIPLPVEAGDESYELIFNTIVLPITREYQPDIIIRNGGSDPHYLDSITRLGLTLNGFRMIGEKVKEMSSGCNEKEIDLVTSGYNMKILPQAWLSLIAGLTDIDISLEDSDDVLRQNLTDPSYKDTESVIDKIRSTLKNYWNCLK